MKKVFFSLGLGLAGGAVGNYLDIPLGWLLGAIVANMIASMHSVPVAVPRPLRLGAMSVLGVMLGSAFSPQLLARLPEWGITVAAMIVLLALVIPLSYAYGRWITRLDRRSAVFASIPGGLTEMVALGWSMGANPRTITLAQSARLLTIVVVAPLLLRYFADMDVSASTDRALGAGDLVTPSDVVVLALGAIAGGFAAKLLRAPAPFMVGPMLVAGTLYLSGLAAGRLPMELIAATQVVIGASLGTTFAGARFSELARTFGLSIGLVMLLLALVVVYAGGLSQVTGFEFAALLLAFTPGGLAELAILALLLDVDPVFVATHHTLRVVLIYLLVPLAAARWLKPEDTPSLGDG